MASINDATPLMQGDAPAACDRRHAPAACDRRHAPALDDQPVNETMYMLMSFCPGCWCGIIGVILAYAWTPYTPRMSLYIWGGFCTGMALSLALLAFVNYNGEFGIWCVGAIMVGIVGICLVLAASYRPWRISGSRESMA